MNWREFQALQQVVRCGDRFISYVDQGQSADSSQPPVILLHGIPTWGFLWHDILPALSPQRRTLIPDLIGFGYSDKRDCFDRSIASQAAMVDAWMDRLQIQTADIIAHDIGGGVALRLATLFPHRVSKLCLINSVCYDSWPIELMLQFGHPAAYQKLSAATALGTLKLALTQGFSQRPDSELLDGLLAPYHTEVGKLSLIRNAAALNTNLTTEITHLLPRLRNPTLILWGEEDTFQVLKYGERLAADIPHARCIKIAQARHFVMCDQPQELNQHLQNFLTSPVQAMSPL